MPITDEQFNELKKQFDWLYAKYTEQQDSIDEEKLLDAVRVSDINRLRNTYVFSGNDSLDDIYPFELDFEIVSEMVAIHSVKLSFRIGKFRAYSKTAKSGGGSTSGSGGGQTKTSASYNYGAKTSAAESGTPVPVLTSTGTVFTPVNNVGDENADGYLATSVGGTNVPQQSHTHSVTIGSHTHDITIDDHTHSTPAHAHDLTFGIYEEAQSPIIKVYVDNGNGYGDAIGEFTADSLELELTNYISGIGLKRIKFVSDKRARINAWIMCKIDVRS